MAKKINKLSFEEAIESLDEKVALLEGSAMPLQQALALFGESQELIAHCAQTLDEADAQVKKLMKTTAGFELDDFEEDL